MALLLGYDIGSSSIKATLMEAETGRVFAAARSPEREMRIIAKNPGWAEQNPDMWWEHVVETTRMIRSAARFTASDVKAIGISYQMHGLVMVDKNKEVLRPSIIWCDGRTVEIADRAAADELGLAASTTGSHGSIPSFTSITRANSRGMACCCVSTARVSAPAYTRLRTPLLPVSHP